MDLDSNKSFHNRPLKLVPCRYFIQGQCNSGDRCPYSHASTSATLQCSDGPPPCSFFLQGNCSRGDLCRFPHIDPKELKQKYSKKSSLTNPENRPAQDRKNCARLEDLGTKTTHILGQGSQQKIRNPYEVKVTKRPTSFADAVGPLKKPPVPKPSLNPNAAAFVPSFGLEASFQSMNLNQTGEITYPVYPESHPTISSDPIDDFCPEHSQTGVCSVQSSGLVCIYMKHGDQCPICTLYLLDPSNPSDGHMEKCNRKHEEDLELSCKIQDSENQACTICMEIVWQKLDKSHRRFGILENCEHCFCLGCVREWRATSMADTSAIRGCPECRVESFFVIPSEYFVKGEEKELLIDNYKIALSQKECKYFKKGRGECPFGTSCFYKHMFADGTLQDRSEKKTIRFNQDGARINLLPSHPLFEMLRDELTNINLLNGGLTADQFELDAEMLQLLEMFGDDNGVSDVTDESDYDYEDDQVGNYYVD